ncbi:tRNA glutamyl-Q(34) synthetase GluQRS [Brevundimonas sp. 2R-24]|uniref:tRNA glutamyl-Q(34) synthetase GluQRS n=1 Tax=Peiella sedimenti TaxID=3061083 RepID=A0ABT8SLW1_9CAUL|nr:tRNA glutamyl-Q(34) synthetase GluQRS [Caulobacteraceae bacterium XZ-24]
MVFTTRFAPSPTGRLHLGHAFSALTAERAAREAGGRFLLRIEDIDPTRCKPEFEAGILEDLEWLGLSWETPVRRQSDHLGDYAAVLDRMQSDGLIYRCFLTRTEVAERIGQAPHGALEAYVGAPLPPDEEAQRLEAGDAFAWRLSLAAAQVRLGRQWDCMTFTEEGSGPDGETGALAVDPARGGDVVLARKDAQVAYHLACVHDDAAQGVTHVIRGQDLFEAVHVQRLLQALLNLPEPVYRHHRLITDETGRRLAKRDKDQTLKALRDSGVTPTEIRERLGL